MVKNPPANARDAGDIGSIPGSLIPGLGRSPGEWNSNLLQYSCLVNSVDSGACWVAVLWVAKESDTDGRYFHMFISRFVSFCL